MTRTPTRSDQPPLNIWRRVAAWLRERWPADRPRLLLAGLLLVTSGLGAMVATVGVVQRQRGVFADAGPDDASGLAAEVAVVGLALEVERVPPGLAAGTQVAVLDTGGGGGTAGGWGQGDRGEPAAWR